MSVISGMKSYIADKVSEMGADRYFVQREPMAEFDTKKLEALRRAGTRYLHVSGYRTVVFREDIDARMFPSAQALTV
jgi:hypothetical protein